MKQLLKPSTRLLWWLVGLAGFAVLLGVLQSLGRGPTARLDDLFWALLCVIGVLAALDGFWLWRLSSPRVQRHLPGSLALGRWSEVRIEIQHDWLRSVPLSLFDHGPEGPGNHFEMENLPQLSTAPHQPWAFHVRTH
jgi:hypothetical protein